MGSRPAAYLRAGGRGAGGACGSAGLGGGPGTGGGEERFVLHRGLLSPSSLCSPKGGYSREGGPRCHCLRCPQGCRGPPHACFTEHAVWVQRLEGSVCVARPCLCGGKMLQLGVSVYLLGFFSVKPNAGNISSPPS